MKTFEILYLTGDREVVEAKYMSFPRNEDGAVNSYHFHGGVSRKTDAPFLMVNPVTVAQIREITEEVTS